MTILHTEEIKPIDVLYNLIGGEDRTSAPDGTAELYDDLGVKKEWVDKFNAILEDKFPTPSMDWEVERYIRENCRMLAYAIFGRERA